MSQTKMWCEFPFSITAIFQRLKSWKLIWSDFLDGFSFGKNQVKTGKSGKGRPWLSPRSSSGRLRPWSNSYKTQVGRQLRFSEIYLNLPDIGHIKFVRMAYNWQITMIAPFGRLGELKFQKISIVTLLA